MNWLLSNLDFRLAVGENDWMIKVFWDNGIICEKYAILHFIYSNTDFDIPDCPFCGANDNRHYPLRDNYWKCKRCRKKFSLTTSKYIDNTKIPITHWWRFSWLVGNKKIINSCAISRDLEVTQKTAWIMLDRLRKSMTHSGINLVNGTIDLNSTEDVIRLLMRTKKILRN